MFSSIQKNHNTDPSTQNTLQTEPSLQKRHRKKNTGLPKPKLLKTSKSKPIRQDGAATSIYSETSTVLGMSTFYSPPSVEYPSLHSQPPLTTEPSDVFGNHSHPSAAHMPAQPIEQQQPLDISHEMLYRSRIGEGGFGTVHALCIPEMNAEQPVAVKLAGQGQEQILLQESEVYERIGQSHHLPQSFGIKHFDIQDGPNPGIQPALCIEYINGYTLDKVMAKVNTLYDQKKLSDRDYSNIIRYLNKGMLEGVHDITSKGYIHGDIKSQNVMLSCDDKNIKLLDLGNATPIDKPQFNAFSTGYAAPEVFAQSQISNLDKLDEHNKLTADRRTDVFSVRQITQNMISDQFTYLNTPMDPNNYGSIFTQGMTILQGLKNKESLTESPPLSPMHKKPPLSPMHKQRQIGRLEKTDSLNELLRKMGHMTVGNRTSANTLLQESGFIKNRTMSDGEIHQLLISIMQ